MPPKIAISFESETRAAATATFAAFPPGTLPICFTGTSSPVLGNLFTKSLMSLLIAPQVITLTISFKSHI